MKRIYLVLLLFCLFVPVNAQWLWNINKLNTIKKELNSPAYSKAYIKLIGEADRNIKKKTYSVTFKEGLAPSGDNHDYVSLSRYYWPDTSKKDGLPYINKDGESNPELEKCFPHRNIKVKNFDCISEKDFYLCRHIVKTKIR